MLLRKRGAEIGPRASWAFNPGELLGASEEANDTIPAVKSNTKDADDASEQARPHSQDSPPAELDAQLEFTAGQESDHDSEEYSEDEGHHSGRHAASVLEAVDLAVDAAATQLMSKALRFMSLESSPPRTRASPTARTAAPPRSPLARHESSSFLDKGLDAITGVGKLVEGFAVTLDNVIGQAFDEWGTPKAPGREGKKKMTKPVGTLEGAGNRKMRQKAVQNSPEGTIKAGWEDFDVDEDQEGVLGISSAAKRAARTPIASSVGGSIAQGSSPSPAALSTVPRGETAKEIQQWRRRAQILQKELQKLRAQRDEYKRVKEEYEALQRELQEKKESDTTDLVEPQEGENSHLGTTSSDPLAGEQVMRQMEALVAEKARLAQENDRLMRENTGLHELLEFTMQQHVAELGEDDLFGDGDMNSSCEINQEESYCSSTGGDEEEDGVAEWS